MSAAMSVINRTSVTGAMLWLLVFTTVFDAELAPIPALLSLVIVANVWFPCRWLYFRFAKHVDAGPGLLSSSVWLLVALLLGALWRNDSGDWHLRDLITFHANLAGLITALVYAYWWLLRKLRARRHRTAQALKRGFAFTALVLVGIAALVIANELLWISRQNDVASKRIKVHPQATLRFKDVLVFGATTGVWGWRESESISIEPIFNQLGDVSAFASVDELLLAGSASGLFCIDDDMRKVSRVAYIPSASKLLRSGKYVWAWTGDGELLKLDATASRCDSLQVTAMAFGDAMVVRAGRTRHGMVFAACPIYSAAAPSAAPCAIYWWPQGDTGLPRQVGVVQTVMDITSMGDRLWVAAGDGLYEVRGEEAVVLRPISLVRGPVRSVFTLEGELLVQTDGATWRLSSDGLINAIPQVSSIQSVFNMGGYHWARTHEGFHRWRAEGPVERVHSEEKIGQVRSHVAWNGCFWLGAENGLFRYCEGRKQVLERVASEIESVSDLLVAGWERGVPPDVRPTSDPDLLWVASDGGVLRFSTSSPDRPIMVNGASKNAQLVIAGDYLWILSAGRMARWRLDSTAQVEALGFKPRNISRVCTDLTAAWFVDQDQLIRVPDVRSPSFLLDFDVIEKGQPTLAELIDHPQGLRYDDARYWNCQSPGNPPFAAYAN